MGKIGSTIELQGEAQFKSAVQGCTSALKLMSSEMKSVEQQTSGSANSLESLSRKHDVLARTLDKQKEKYDAISRVVESQKQKYNNVGNSLEKYKTQLAEAKAKLEEMRTSGTATEEEIEAQKQKVTELSDSVQRGTKSYQNHERTLNDWQKKLVDAGIDIESTNQQLAKNEMCMDEARNSADGCATSIDKFGNAAKTLSSDLADTVVQVSKLEIMKEVARSIGDIVELLSGVSNDVFEFGGKFDTAMSSVGAISKASGEDMARLSDKAREMGETTKYSASEAADAMNYMAVAGWTSQQMIDGIGGVLQLAAAGGMELGQAADVVAGNLAAFNLQAGDAAKLSDIMATAQAKSKTTASQLAEAYSTSATNMTQYGQSVETTTALLEAMASMNDTGSAAGTKLNAVLAQMIAKMENGAIAIGDTSVAVQDSNGNMRDMVDIIADIESAVDGMGTAERAAALATTFNRTSLNGLNEIIGVGSDKLREYRGELENSTGAATDMANAMMDNFEGDVKLMESAWEGLADTIWDSTNGKARKGIQTLTDVLGDMNAALKEAPQPVKDFVGSLTVGVQAGSKVAPTLEKIATLTMSVSQAKSLATLAAQGNAAAEVAETGALAAHTTALSAATVAQTAFNAAAGAAPFVLLAAIAGLAGKAIYDYAVAGQDASESMAAMNQDIYSTIDAAEESRSAMERAGAAIRDSFDGVGQSLSTVSGSADLARDLVGELAELEGQTSLTTDEQARMQSIVAQLNSIYPELNASIDGTTGKLNMSTDAMLDFIASAEQMAMVTAYQDAMADAASKLVDAQMAQKKQEEELATIGDRLGSVQEKNGHLLEKENAAREAAKEANEKYQASLKDVNATEEERQALLEKSEQAQRDLQNAMDATSAFTETYISRTQDLTDAQDAQRASVKAGQDTLNDAQKGIKDITSSYQDYLKSAGLVQDANGNITDSNGNVVQSNGELAESAEDTAEAVGQSAEEIKEQYDKIYSDLYESTYSTSDLFKKFEQDTSVTLQSMAEALQSQSDAYANFNANMNAALSDARYGADANFTAIVNSILDMGIDGAAYLQAFVDGANGDSSALDAILSDFGNVTENKDNYIKQMAEFKTGAEQAVEDHVSALEAGAPKAKAATEKITQGTTETLEKSSTETGKQGEKAGTSYADGLRSTASAASSAASSIANGALNEFIATSNNSHTWGIHMGNQFASGLSATTATVRSAATSVAAAASAVLHHTTPDEGPLAGDDKWGFEMAEQFAKGISLGALVTNKASRRLAHAAAQPIKELKSEKGKVAKAVTDYSEIIKQVNESEAKSFDDLYKSALKATKQSSSLFKEIADNEKVNFASMTKGLESQYLAYNGFAKNLETLTSSARYKTDANFRGIVNSLSQMGVSGQQYLKLFADAVKKGGKDLDKILGDWNGLENAKKRFATQTAKIEQSMQEVTTKTEVDAKKLKQTWIDLTNGLDAEVKTMFEAMGVVYDETTDKVKNLSDTEKRSTVMTKEAIAARKKALDDYEKLVAKVTSNTRYKSDKNYKAMADTMIQMGAKGEKALKNFSDMAYKNGNDLDKLTKKYGEVNQKYTDELKKLKEVSESVADELKKKWQEVYDSARKSVDGQNDLFKEYHYDQEQTLDSMVDALNNQQIALEAYATNVNYILNSSRYQTDKEFQSMADSIMSMGMEGATYLDRFAAAARGSSSDLEALITAYKGASKAKNDYAKAMADMQTGLSGGTLELAKSITKQRKDVEAAAGAVAEAAALKFRELVEKAEETGKDTGENISDGMKDEESNVGDAAAKLSETTGSNIQYTHAYQDGASIGANMAAGMRSQAAAVAAAAAELAAAAAGYLHHSTPDKGALAGDDKWGAELSQNFASGIRAGIKDAEGAASDLAKYTAGALNREITPSAAMINAARTGSTRQTQNRTVVENRFYLGDREVTNLITNKVVRQITQQMKNQTVSMGGY